MSLNFVSKSVQTAKEDGGFEEKPIDGTTPSDDIPIAKPLHQQLLENQRKALDLKEEQERDRMRGTLALDEEDVAHLDSLRQQRDAELARRRQDTQEQLAAFRAAKMDHMEAAAAMSGVQKGDSEAKLPRISATTAIKKKNMAPVIFKKRKRKTTEDDKGIKATKQEDTAAMTPSEPSSKGDKPSAGIGGLLSGYGSSASDDESE